MPDDLSLQVVAAVIRRDGRYFVAQRPAHKHHGGLWEFPGGKIASDESPAQALARELREELDVTLLECGPCLYAEQESEAGLTIQFITAVIKGDPVLLEHSAMAWCALADLQTLAMAPADARFVRAQWAADPD